MNVSIRGKRFTTYETVERMPLMLIKRDGTRQAYDRQKLLNGLVKACEKRPVSLMQLEQIVDHVEQKLFGSLESEVSSKVIGELVMEQLRKVDEVAYVRASVYRQFKDIKGFPGRAEHAPQTKINNSAGMAQAVPVFSYRKEDGFMDERLQKQLNFILEIDKEKNIFRQTHLSGHGRRENDAEHAWHMAVMAYLLQEYSNEPVDVARVMLMCLLHDVVEIDAGDTYAYDTDGLKTQKAREDAAKQRIYSLLPDDQKRGLMAVFDEFEADETAEAHFAHAMDNLQPLLLNNSNGGSDWADHDVTAKQVYGRQSRTEKGSAYLYKLTDNILQANIKKGALKEK